jgi:hypothetical protein
VKMQALHWVALELLWGPTPVEVALAELRTFSGWTDLDENARMELLVIEGALRGLAGDFEQARRLAAEGRRALLELGQKVQYAGFSQPVAIIELLSGDARAAERILQEAREILAAAGERGFLSTVLALLALAVAKQGRHDEAGEIADESRRIGAEDDIVTQIYWRVAKAQAVAGGDPSQATQLAAETIELTATYDSFDSPTATVEVARFLEPDVARAALEGALAGAVAKGNVVTAERAREMLAAPP